MHIYGLFESDTGELRYVGKTIKPLIVRLRQHLYPSSLRSSCYRSRWIKLLRSRGARIVIAPIQTLSCDKDLDNAEIYWIGFLAAQGCRLVNSSLGGRGGSPMLGRKQSIQTKTRMSESAKARGIRPPSRLGARMPESLRQKLSALNKGRTPWMKGKMHSSAAKAKMSLTKRKPRRKWSDKEALALRLQGFTLRQIAIKLKACTKTLQECFAKAT